MYNEQEFVRATHEALTTHGVPSDQARQCAEILNQQNLGNLPCPLLEPELGIVRDAWEQAMGAAEEIGEQWLVNKEITS